MLWLNKANQEIDSEHIPIMNHLFKFYNKNASSVRAIMMAKCPWLDETNDPLAKLNPAEQQDFNDEQSSCSGSNSAGNPLSHAAPLRTSMRSISPEDDYLQDIDAEPHSHGAQQRQTGTVADATIRYLDEYRREYPINEDNMPSDDDEDMEQADEYDDMENSIPKYLIFSTGSKTYTPHQIGIKRIRHVTFPKKLDPGPSLKERIAARKAEKQAIFF